MALGRYGHPRDVAGVVAYLAGPERGVHHRRATRNVDGGFTVISDSEARSSGRRARSTAGTGRPGWAAAPCNASVNG